MSEPELTDVYIDKRGGLWRVVGIFRQPTVILQEISPDARPEVTLAIESPLFRDMQKVGPWRAKP